jgi:manganese/zinc/iron transport system permease protein
VVIIAVALGALFVPFSRYVLGVRYTYTLRVVALGGVALGLAAGGLGSFAVLRHQSLLGDALSHAALPGVAVAFLISGRGISWLLLGAGLASWIGVAFIRSVTTTTRIKQDTAMGIVLAAWFAAGIALLAYIQDRPDASQAGLDSFIFGQAASMVERDVWVITLVGIASFIVLALFWKEFKLITFDQEFAHANGFRVRAINSLLSFLIVVAIVLGLQVAGVVLMAGLLIAPGIAARQWTNKLGQMIVLATVFGAVSGGTGAVLSAVDADIPTGPMIIVTAFLLVAISLVAAPGRGILWNLIRRRTDRRRFAATSIRREIFHFASHHGESVRPMPEMYLVGSGGSTARQGLRQLLESREIELVAGGWILTPVGIASARADVRNQLRWEAYRRYADEMDLPSVPEDRQTDITTLLPEQAVLRLDGRLEDSDGPH